MNRFVTISLCLLLFLSACGTLEISVDRTPTPNLGATAVVGSLQAQNAQLATQNATLNPVSAALTMDSSSEIIRQKMQATSTFWQTIFVDGTITWYAPEGETAPAQVFHEQDWIDHPTHRFRVLLGPAGGAAETFKACDGVTILNIDLKSGQSQSNPLPKFAQDTSPVAGQDMLWGQIGTPLSEIALSTDYAATGGGFVPLRTRNRCRAADAGRRLDTRRLQPARLPGLAGRGNRRDPEAPGVRQGRGRHDPGGTRGQPGRI